MAGGIERWSTGSRSVRPPLLTCDRLVESFSPRPRLTVAMPFYKVTLQNASTRKARRQIGRKASSRLTDGVVLNAAKAEVIEPAGMHSQEVMDEDDAFLHRHRGLGIRNRRRTRAGIYRRARTSQKVIQYEQMDEVI